MVNVILAGHGESATGILSAAEMICGVQKDIIALSLQPGMSAEEFGELLQDTIASLDSQDEIIIFTDLMGGTPSNQSLKILLSRDDIEVVTGLNLPMLLEAIFLRTDKTAKEVAKLCIENSIEGIVNLKASIQDNKIKKKISSEVV